MNNEGHPFKIELLSAYKLIKVVTVRINNEAIIYVGNGKTSQFENINIKV